ncbi:MAG: hypothetical protein IMF01_08710 [Proteobacteria bacterium]|nr:hypothetical protein [Pseudomonadota bacterium]
MKATSSAILITHLVIPEVFNQESILVVFHTCIDGLLKEHFVALKPSPDGESWVTTAWMQEVEQRMERLPRRS